MTYTITNETYAIRIVSVFGIHDIMKDKFKDLRIQGTNLYIHYNGNPDGDITSEDILVISWFDKNGVANTINYDAVSQADAATLRDNMIADIGAASSTALLTTLIDRVEELDGGFGVLIGKIAGQGGDFIVDPANPTADDLTITGLPAWYSTLTSDAIEKIVQINAAGSVVATYLRDEVPMAVAAGVLTVTGATFAGTDEVIVYTNVSKDTRSIYDEDTAHSSGDPGTFILGVRNDAGTALAADGDYIPLQVNDVGALNTNSQELGGEAIDLGAGNTATGTQRVTISTDDANLAKISGWDSRQGEVVGTDGAMTMLEAKTSDAAAMPNSVTEGQNVRTAGSLYGVQYVNLVSQDGSMAVAPIPNANYSSARGDFTATINNGAKTIAVAGITIDSDDQLKYVMVTLNAGGTRWYINGMNCTMTHSAGTITIGGGYDGAQTTDVIDFATGDVVDVGVLKQDKAYDATNNAFNVAEIAPEWSHRTSPESGSSIAIDNSFTSQGEIAMDTYNHLTWGFDLTIGTSTAIWIKVVGLMTSGGSEYILDPQEWALRDSVLSADEDYRILNRNASDLYAVEINTNNTFKFIKVYVRDNSDGTGTYDYEYSKSIKAS